MVEGRLWGVLGVGTSTEQPLPPDAETRLASFTELVAMAIANAESPAALTRLAEEQAALRRVATLVAQGVPPAEIFSAVSDEVARLFGADAAVLRLEHNGPAIVFVGISETIELPVGTRWEFQTGMASAEVYRTGCSARVDAMDWPSASGPVAGAARHLGIVSTVASPIVAEGRLWGAMSVASTDELLPHGMEGRLEKFTELLATAIANAESRSELGASRRRIVAASDQARRRIERDLHDGTQQRPVSGQCRTVLNKALLAHNPEVAGPNPAPATKQQVRDLFRSWKGPSACRMLRAFRARDLICVSRDRIAEQARLGLPGRLVRLAPFGDRPMASVQAATPRQHGGQQRREFARQSPRPPPWWRPRSQRTRPLAARSA